jgi:hypothetical protein
MAICPAASPSRRRGNKSLLIRRDATLRIACLKAGERLAGALHLDLFEQPGKDDFFSSLLYHVGKFSLHKCRPTFFRVFRGE